MQKDRTQLQVDVFARQIEHMADAYMDFEVAVAEEDGIPSSCAVPAPEGSKKSEMSSSWACSVRPLSLLLNKVT
jgi:hypothetical protein